MLVWWNCQVTCSYVQWIAMLHECLDAKEGIDPIMCLYAYPSLRLVACAAAMNSPWIFCTLYFVVTYGM